MPIAAECTREVEVAEKATKQLKYNALSGRCPMHKFQTAKTHQHLVTLIDCTPRKPQAPIEWYEYQLNDVIDAIGMDVLIPARVEVGPYGITGIVGIVTSHIAFHYFPTENHLQFDIYSCKKFDQKTVFATLNKYWSIHRISGVEIDRSAESLVLKTSPSLNEIRYGKDELDFLF